MYVGVCLCVGLFLLYNTDVVYSVNSVIDIRIDSYTCLVQDTISCSTCS